MRSFSCPNAPNPSPWRAGVVVLGTFVVLSLVPGRALAQAGDARVEALMEADRRAGFEAWPPWGSSQGERRFDALMPDVSPEARARRLAATRRRLATLEAIAPSSLSPRGRLNADLFRHALRLKLASARFRTDLAPIGPLGGPQQWVLQMATRVPYERAERRRAFLERLRAIPAYLEAEIKNLRAGLASGRTPPRVVLGDVARQARAHTSDATRRDPSTHPLFKPFKQAPPALQAEARAVLRDDVIPAFRRLATFLEDTYLPGCRASLDAHSWPEGRAYYAHCLRQHSTTDLSASEIHATGLKEVARIRREMAATIERTDFRSAARGQERFQAFLRHLRTSPRFYYETEAELLTGYRDIAKRVDAELPRLFRVLPRLPYGVRAMNPAIAPSSPTAYYYHGRAENGVAGNFVANTHALGSRPRYSMIPLTLHEAVPGHHLQIALAQELEGQPAWRREQSYTAFVEGWALYAERLGLEMGEGERGLYSDPYDDFGRLTYEMWRAMRLVVDTGIHAQGWTRRRAIDYMLANSALTRVNVEREVDRYISWPGQAVAYKLGELRIRALRADAEKRLGASFDLRAFHDVVLGQGAVPLNVLSAQVERWVKARERGAF